MPEQELTRRVMYDLVWAKPMTHVAQEFGISDVALKKICHKHRVPTPPRGYWAKKEAGKPVKEVRLRDTAETQDERIVIYGSRNNLAPEICQVLDQERERRKSSPRPSLSIDPAATVLVDDVHPAAAATARVLRKAKPDSEGVVHARGQGYCGIEVGHASIERAIFALDAIARALEQRGLKLEPTENCMRVSISPDALTFSLTERVESRKHVPTMEELAEEERLRKKEERDQTRGIWNFDRKRAYPELDFIRTGELGIQIADGYVGGLRRNWRDGRHQKVEILVDDIVGGIIAYLAGVKARREENERWQREWRRREQLAALAKARDEREKLRCEFLRQLETISTEVDQLQKLLARLDARMPEWPSGEIQRMMEWVKARLRRLEGELAPERISAKLQERELFPEVDKLAALLEE